MTILKSNSELSTVGNVEHLSNALKKKNYYHKQVFVIFDCNQTIRTTGRRRSRASSRIRDWNLVAAEQSGCWQLLWYRRPSNYITESDVLCSVHSFTSTLLPICTIRIPSHTSHLGYAPSLRPNTPAQLAELTRLVYNSGGHRPIRFRLLPNHSAIRTVP